MPAQLMVEIKQKRRKRQSASRKHRSRNSQTAQSHYESTESAGKIILALYK